MPRWCPAACTISSHEIFIFGGWAKDPDMFLNDAFIFDTETETWSRLECSGDLPRPSCQSSAMLYRDNYILLYGGAYRSAAADGQKYGDYVHDMTDVYIFDLKLRTWVKAKAEGPMSSVHSMIPMKSDGSVAIVIGGMHTEPNREDPNFHSAIQKVQVRF
jgi:N-acetylneuraminic acid mutarotase